jgi:hypothetical protein
MQKKIIPLFIALLLFIGFIMRITTHTYPYGVDDSNRDYLVAHHIVAYHEYPLTGPFAAITQSRNSPSYYYFLATFSSIKDDPIFLRVVSSVLQVVTILIVYILAKKLFDLKTALLASVLISFNYYSLVQAAFIWQPWVMQPFINLSYLLLLLSYQKRKYSYLLVSIFFFIFSGSLHTSVFALFPIFLIILFIILKNQKATPRHFLGAITTLIISFLVFYLPVIFASLNNSTILPSLQAHMVSINTPGQMFFQFFKNITYFTVGSFSNVVVITPLSNLFALSICVLLAIYFWMEKQKKERLCSLLLLAPILLIMICFALVYVRIFKSNYGIHYYTPVYGLFIILLARAFVFIFTKTNRLKITGIFLISFYLAFFFSFIFQKFYLGKPTYSLRHLNDPAINAVKTDILSLKNNNNYKDYGFFYIDSEKGDVFGWKYNSTIWAVLERELGTRLVRLDDYNREGFKQLNGSNSKYIFLICPASTNLKRGEQDCLGKYLEKNKYYEYEKTTYASQTYKIGLLKRTY